MLKIFPTMISFGFALDVGRTRSGALEIPQPVQAGSLSPFSVILGKHAYPEMSLEISVKRKNGLPGGIRTHGLRIRNPMIFISQHFFLLL